MSLPARRPRGPDRRPRPTPAAAAPGVDRSLARGWCWLLALTALAVVDWAWTLVHLQRGVTEANPLLALVLEHGGAVLFSVAKLGVTAAATFVLLVHARQPLAQRLLPLTVVLYALVMVAHLATAIATA